MKEGQCVEFFYSVIMSLSKDTEIVSSDAWNISNDIPMRSVINVNANTTAAGV